MSSEKNVYFDYSKTKIAKAVGGYASSLHDLGVLLEKELGKGIIGICALEQINIDNENPVNYVITTMPNTNLPFLISSSDTTIAKYSNSKIQELKNGTVKIYVDLAVGMQTMRMETKVVVSNIIGISEGEVLKYFGLTKKGEYVVGFKAGSSISNIKKLLSNYPNVKFLVLQMLLEVRFQVISLRLI